MPCCNSCAGKGMGLDKDSSALMKAAYAGAIGGVGRLVLRGMDGQVLLPGGIALPGPLGMAVHVGLSSYASEAYVAENLVSPLITSYTSIVPFANTIATTALTPGLLMLAQNSPATNVEGALVAAVGQAVVDYMVEPTTSGGGGGGKGVQAQASYEMGARMYSSGVGYQYGYGIGGGSSGYGQTASMYGQGYK